MLNNNELATAIYFHRGHKSNFLIFEPEDFIAAVCSHVPNHRQKYVNYYGWYSSRLRGKRKIKNAENKSPEINTVDTILAQKVFRKTWAILIQKVWDLRRRSAA